MSRLTKTIIVLAVIMYGIPAYGQVQLAENFDSGNTIPTSSSSAPSSPTNYNTSSGTWTLFKAYRHGTANYSAPYALRLLKNTAEAPSYAITPALNSAGSISFWAYGSTVKPIVIYKSIDGGTNWVLVDTVMTGSGTFIFCSVTINDASSNLKLKIENGTGAGNDLNFDDVEITTYSAAPTIMLSAASLQSFGTIVAGSSSSSSSYSLSAYNLTGNVSVNAPTGYQLSLDETNYSNTISIPQSAGIINTTNIYVRFTPSSAIGSVDGNISHESAGAETKYVSVSGVALAAEPTVQPTVTFGAVTGNSIVVNFSGGNGMKRIIAAKKSTSVNWLPSDGVVPTGINSNFSSAVDQGLGNKIVYSGNDNTVTVTGLEGNSVYYFSVFEFNEGTNNSQNYNTTSPGTGNQATSPTATIIVNPTSISFGNVEINTTSTEKTYSVSANTLSPASGNIVVTAPNGFEVSLTSGTGFTTSIQIPYSNSVLTSTTLYVRFKPTQISLYSGSISNSGGDAPTVNITVSGNGISQSEPNVLQAEDGIFQSSYVRQQYTGYTGWGYVDLGDRTGSSLEFVFKRETAATDVVTVYYANGGSSRSLRITLNDVILGTLNFPTTGSWSTWSTVTYSVPLAAGINRLNFSSTTNASNANIDKILIAGQTATPVYKLTLLKSGGGTVAASSTDTYFDIGATVTISATPSAGNVFYNWNGTDVTYANPYSMTMNSHKTQVAVMMDTTGISSFPYESSPRGFASVHGLGYSNGTTGGASIENHVVYVSTVAELTSVMQGRIDANGTLGFPPLTVYVVGILSRDSGIGEMVDVKDVYDISIIGVGSDATITGFGLNITRSKNIIVRNIKFASWSDDAISVDANDDVNKGNHVWIDHCTFTYTPPAGYPAASGPDGSVDITHTATYVTVSFCLFDGTDKNSLVGHSNSNVVDTAMRVTYHHNWFKNSNQRNPRVRFCKVHVFNNYYTNNSIYGVSSNLEADVLVEGNYFYNTPIPTETSRDGSPPGDLVERYNIFVDCGTPGTRGAAFEASDYYYYALDPAAEIPQIVPPLAGSGIYDFSNPNYIVPVELVSFTASVNGANAVLQWITATELNNHGFEVQRKNKNSNWINVSFVNGNGTSTEKSIYSYTDIDLHPGKYEYRLKQVDYDGKYTYSPVISVEIGLTPGKFELAQNYPNPFNPVTTISFTIGASSFVSLKIFDVLGNEIEMLVNEEMQPGAYSKSFSASKFASGVYYYRLSAGGYVDTKKMLLLK